MEIHTAYQYDNTVYFVSPGITSDCAVCTYCFKSVRMHKQHTEPFKSTLNKQAMYYMGSILGDHLMGKFGKKGIKN